MHGGSVGSEPYVLDTVFTLYRCACFWFVLVQLCLHYHLEHARKFHLPAGAFMRGGLRLLLHLCGALQAEFVKLVDKRAQDEANAAASNNAGHADSNGTTGSSSGSSSKAKSRQQQQSEQVRCCYSSAKDYIAVLT